MMEIIVTLLDHNFQNFLGNTKNGNFGIRNNKKIEFKSGFPPPEESCHVSPIPCIHSRQIILLCIKAELGFVAEKFFYDILVFFRLYAAGAVYQIPSGFQHGS